MTQVFYAASAVAVLAAFLTVTRSNALDAVLYLILALFALAIDSLPRRVVHRRSRPNARLMMERQP